MTTKVALYCRVSTSTKDQTTENQLRELTAYCDRMDYEVVKIYEDEVSGAKTREKRPAYNQLCKDAFLKKFDLVIAWDVYPDAGTLFPRSVCRDSRTETLGEQTI